MAQKINDIHIGATDNVFLSREKILMYYGTIEEFRKFYGISPGTMKRSFSHGVRWGTLTKSNGGTPISKAYIDWSKTKFHIVDAETKAAYVKVSEYENGIS